ncbi:hypothetical protein DPEC_G00351930 [Dallia pectoralis]|uniref:Uncharacterized protein n=1 Tax=Dallia pectoralis TaxID=75939 RepID=A0ACC2F254_DALPE|nr:hypothetical protein DPEC_G00351930 [Dallia pectoralis]
MLIRQTNGRQCQSLIACVPALEAGYGGAPFTTSILDPLQGQAAASGRGGEINWKEWGRELPGATEDTATVLIIKSL